MPQLTGRDYGYSIIQVPIFQNIFRHCKLISLKGSLNLVPDDRNDDYSELTLSKIAIRLGDYNPGQDKPKLKIEDC